MNKGQTVIIYEDPFTRQKAEGQARLIECVNNNAGLQDGTQYQIWQVEFLDEPGRRYPRLLAPALDVVSGAGGS